jgi:hypothetical protein
MNRVIGYLLIAFGLVAGSILLYERITGPRRTQEIGRLTGLLQAAGQDLAESQRETAAANAALDSALSRSDSVITRWRTKVVHDTTVILRTAHDTITQLARELRATKAAGDSVVRACSQLADSCRDFRAKATAEISSWERRYALLDSLHRAPRPQKHWNLSVSAGYGFSMRGDTLVRSPFVGVSVGRSLVRW